MREVNSDLTSGDAAICWRRGEEEDATLLRIATARSLAINAAAAAIWRVD